MKEFLVREWPNIEKGLAVMVVFLAVVYWSVVRKPKHRAGGRPYLEVIGTTGTENDWDKPAA